MYSNRGWFIVRVVWPRFAAGMLVFFFSLDGLVPFPAVLLGVDGIRGGRLICGGAGVSCSSSRLRSIPIPETAV